MNKITAIFFLILPYSSAIGQPIPKKNTFPLTTTDGLSPVHVAVAAQTYLDKPAIRIWDTALTNSEVKFAKLIGPSFHNGTIEVELAGKPLPTAGDSARGFLGIAFRINDSDSEFECIYLRPTNGRALDQVRRNHSIQYISYPNYPWYRSRKETPEKYESYVDLEAGQWTKLRIEVQNGVARLYVHGVLQPNLIVSDLKHGADRKGSIGLWIGPGTNAYFRNLVVTQAD